MRNTNYISIIIIFVVFFLTHNLRAEEFSATFLGDYPDEKDYWGNEVQGIAHDDNNWYVTRADALIRIPKTRNLNYSLWTADFPPILDPEISLRGISGYPELSGYNHFSGFDYYKYKGEGFLLVPVEGEGKPKIVAVFHANKNLDYIGRQEVGTGRWLAVSPSGVIYFPEGGSALTKYSMDWEALQSEGIVSIRYVGIIPLQDESGNPLGIAHPQGGVFSPQGNLIYLSDGYFDDGGNGGIHVVDFQSGIGRRIAKSTNGYGDFNYAYDSSCGTRCEEPEGLTWWNLDGGGAPGISGQLHAILLDNDWPDSDDIYLKHFRVQEPAIQNWNIENEEIRSGIQVTYTAAETITAKSFVIESGADVTFHAGDKIRLEKGFNAKRGSRFYGYTD